MESMEPLIEKFSKLNTHYYLFGVETTTKKRKIATIEPGQKNIKEFFTKINK